MSLVDKPVFVTGANGGLGLATCTAALREGASVVPHRAHGGQEYVGGSCNADGLDDTGRVAPDARIVIIGGEGAAAFPAPLLWSRHLERQAREGMDVVRFTPGLIAGTSGTAGMPFWQQFLLQRVAFPILVALGKVQGPEAAAGKCLECLSGRLGDNGPLLGALQGKALGPLTDQTPMHPLLSVLRLQHLLWQACEAAVGEMPLHPARRRSA